MTADEKEAAAKRMQLWDLVLYLPVRRPASVFRLKQLKEAT